MKKKIIIPIFILIIVLSNVHPFSTILEMTLDEGHYRYSNYSGSFTITEIPYKADIRFVNVLKGFEAFQKHEQHNLSDKVLYRLFWRNPLCFWRWRDYITGERYKLPYMNFNDVKKRRGKNWQGDNYYQRF